MLTVPYPATPATTAERCRREIAAIEAWIAANPGHREQCGATIGWLDWQAELHLIERENQRIMDSGSTEPE